MAKLTRALATAVVAVFLLGMPAVVQIGNAAQLPKAESTLPKSDKAQVDAAIRKANMAAEKSQGDKAFIKAVKSKDSAKVKAILVKNGAPDALTNIKFVGPTPGAQRIKVTVTASCCPMTITIVITF